LKNLGYHFQKQIQSLKKPLQEMGCILMPLDLAQVMAGTAAPGDMLNLPNWILFILGKMVGAVVVSWMIRQRENRGEVDPAAA
jgi:hypothetical protein